MKYKVELTDLALKDLFDISDYYLENVSDEVASDIIDELENTVYSLAEQPKKGHIPPEMVHLGISEYLEIRSGNYRVFYTIVGKAVYVLSVLDARRNVEELLHQRMLLR